MAVADDDDSKLTRDDAAYGGRHHVVPPESAGDDPTPARYPVYSDVPTGAALVRSEGQQRALARRVAGIEPPDECRFHCPMCGWSNTLKFDDDEIEALGGDVTNYVGPCPSCSNQTLIPYNKMYDNAVSAEQKATANRRKQYEEQADVFLDRAGQALGDMMTGSVFDKPDEEKVTKDHVAASHVPGNRPDLPDAADVDLSDLTGRKGND